MPKLLKVPEVAEQLNLSPKTIWMWIARKEIGVHRIGGSVRISQSELDRILAEGEQGARRSASGPDAGAERGPGADDELERGAMVTAEQAVEGEELQTLKAVWHVRAGVIPGKGIERYDRLFAYTDSDENKDLLNACNPAYQSIFSARQREAMFYHLQMANPALNKWAELTFQWF